MKRVAGLVQAVEAVSFVTMALLHAGVRIPLGFATLGDVPIRAAVPFEALGGLLLAVAAWALLAARPCAFTATIVGQAVSLLFALLGLYFVGTGRVGGTPLDLTYHEVMAVALATGLALALSRFGAPLRR